MPTPISANRHIPSRSHRQHRLPSRPAAGADPAAILAEAGALLDDLAATPRNETRVLDLLASLSEEHLNKHLEDGQTLLYKAIQSDSKKMVTALLKHGADPWVPNMFTLNTPLHGAVNQGDIDLAVLVMKNARKSGKHLGNELNERGETPLYAAASAGHTEIVKAMLREDGLDTDRECTVDRYENDSRPGRKPIKTALDIALLKGHQECVLALSQHGAKDARGRTALHFAVLYGANDALDALLETKPRGRLRRLLNQRDNAGRTALLYAISDGDQSYADALMQKGADFVRKDRMGKTALYIAVARAKGNPDDLQMVRHLLAAAEEQGALSQVIDSKDKRGKTALMKAVENMDLACVDALLDSGADVSLKTHVGKNAFHFAVEKNQPEILDRLLDAARKQSCLSDCLGASALLSTPTPLISAIHLGRSPCLEKLLEVKYAVESSDAAGNNLLHAAVEQTEDSGLLARCLAAARNHGLFEDLLDGPSVDGKTPLLKAIRLGRIGEMQQLLDVGANARVADDNGLTALGHAIRNKQPDHVLSALLSQLKKDPHFKKLLHLACEGEQRYAPLAFAAKLGNAEHVDALIEAGASIVFSDESSQNALQAALQHGHVELVPRLLAISAEADNLKRLVNARDMEECTALSYALRCDPTARIDALVNTGMDIGAAEAQARKEADACVEAILAAGADPAICDASGKNALHLVIELDRPDLAIKFIAAAKESGSVQSLLEGGAEPPLLSLAKTDLAPRVHALEKSGKGFIEAAEEVDEAFTKWADTLIDAGADLAIRDGNGRNLLHIGAQHGNFDLLLEMFGRKELVPTLKEMLTVADDDGVEPVAHAAAYSPEQHIPQAGSDFREEQEASRRNFMARAFASGASVTAKDKDGKNALHHILELGQFELIPPLLRAAGRSNTVPELITAQDVNGKNALHRAIELDRVDLISAFVKEAHRCGALSGLITAQDVDGKNALHHAIARDQFDLIPSFVEAAQSCGVLSEFINAKDGDGVSPLLHVARHELDGRVAKLRAAGKTEDEALAQAAEDRFLCMGGLVTHGAKLTGTDELKRNVLHWALEAGDLKLAVNLLKVAYEKYADELHAFVNAADSKGMTPLLMAMGHLLSSPAEESGKDGKKKSEALATASKEFADLLEGLVSAGADMSYATPSGTTALHLAAANEQSTVLDIALEKFSKKLDSAEEAESGFKQLLNCEDEKKHTPLYYAVDNNLPEHVRLLVQAGADPQSVSNAEGKESALRQAVTTGRDEIVDMLLHTLQEDELTAEAVKPLMDELHAHPNTSQALILFAIQSCRKSTVELMMRQGVTFECDDKNNALIHYAAHHGANKDVFAFLLEQPLPAAVRRVTAATSWLDAKTMYGYTPLHCATRTGKTEAVALLIEKGSRLDAQDMHERNLFHIAVDKAYDNLIQVALQAAGLHSSKKRETVFRAILEQKDEDGHTPLDFALNRRYDITVTRFVEAIGLADIPLPDRTGNKLFLIQTVAQLDDGIGKLKALFNNRLNKKTEWANSEISTLFSLKLQAEDYEAAMALLPALDDEVLYRHRKVLLDATFDSSLPHEQKHRLASQLGAIYIEQLSNSGTFSAPEEDHLEDELSPKQANSARRFAAILFGSMTMYEGISDNHEVLLERFESAGKSVKQRQEILKLVQSIDVRREETDMNSGIFTDGAPLLPREGNRSDLARLQAMELTARLLLLLDKEKYAL